MSSGKKRVVRQPVAVVGGAPSTAPASVRSAAASPPDGVRPKSKATSAAKSKAAQHPPVVVSSGPLVEPNPKPAAALEDDFPPLPSKNGSTTPPTPKQSYSQQQQHANSGAPSINTAASSTTAGAPSAPLTPHRSLANQAADMLAANAQARANKTQQLSSMLNKVKAGGASGNGTQQQPSVLLHGEEAQQRAKQQPSSARVSQPSPANTNAPSSPTEGLSPLDTSASFDVSSGARQGPRATGGRLLPSSSFSAYSPIAKSSGTRDGDDDESELSIDMEDTADEPLHATAVNRAQLSTSASTPTSASSSNASSLFNRSLNSTRIAQFTNTSAASEGGLSESELNAILSVANSSDATGAVDRAEYAVLCRHLVRLQAAMKDREKDLRMAGELGEAVCVENTKLEANVEELTHSLDAVVDENARLKEEMAAVQRAMDELSRSQQADDELGEHNAPSGEGARRKKGREDSASTALSEFIRSELSTNLLNTSLDSSFDVGAASGNSTPSSSGASTPTAGAKPIKYTGNLILDLTNLHRKLRRERRMWDRNLQALEQTVQLKERERAELLSEKMRLEVEMNDSRALQSQLLKQTSEWEEKEEALREREERLQHDTKIKLATQRKSLEHGVAAAQEELAREREEHAAEAGRRQQLEAQVGELSSRIAQLSQSVQQAGEERQRAEAARQQLEKKVAAAERIVSEVERGKGTESRRLEELTRRAELAEAAVQQEEQKRMELDLELQQTRDSLAEVKQQLAQERRQSEREREERGADASRLREQLAAEREAREQAVREAARSRLAAETAQKQPAPVSTADASTLTSPSSTVDASCQTTAPAATAAAPSAAAAESVVSVESTASLATPHASSRARVSDNQPSTVIAVPSALSPPGSPSAPSAPLWVLPHPMFAVSSKDQELLRAMFSFLTHQWTMALLLLVSNARVKKTVEWIKDKQSNECLSCHSEFGLFTRRHHCRLCGGLYCSDCSNQTVDLTKFRLDNVRVCTPCFQVVGVMTHGESLIVHRTKVNQKIKAADKKKQNKPNREAGADTAASRPATSSAASNSSTPRVSAGSGATTASQPTSRPAPSVGPVSAGAGKAVSSADLQIVSGTPRLKKAKSIAAVAQPSAPVQPSAQPVRTVLDVTPRGSVHPSVAPNTRSSATAAAPLAAASGASAPVPSAAAFSTPAQATAAATGNGAVADESGVQPRLVKKKVVRKVKRVVPVV